MSLGNDTGFSIKFARSGAPVLSYKGKSLQSNYDPQKESHRWATENFSGKEKFYLIVGDPGSSLSSAFLKLGARGASLVLGPKQETDSKGAGITEIQPAENEEWVRELSTLLLPEILENLKVLVWPSAKRILPQLMEKWSNGVLNICRQIQGTVLQRKYFAKRHFTNIFLKDLHPLKVSKWVPDKTPAILVGAGPSLMEQREILEQFSNTHQIWCLSSSLKTLKDWGIPVHAVVSMDPGNHAKDHLEALDKGTPLFLAVSGAFVHQYQGPVILFHTGNQVEKTFLKSRNLPALGISSQGTVALAALNLLLKVPEKKILLLGMDLCFNDLFTHAHPHTWTRLYNDESTRTQPSLTLLKKRQKTQSPLTVKGMQTSPGMETYFIFLDSLSPYPSNRVRRITGSGLPISCFSEYSQDFFSQAPFGNQDLQIIQLEDNASSGLFLETILREGSCKGAAYGELFNPDDYYREISGAWKYQRTIEPKMWAKEIENRLLKLVPNWEGSEHGV